MKSKTMARIRSNKHYNIGAVQICVSFLAVCHYSFAFQQGGAKTEFKSKGKRKLRRGDRLEEKSSTQAWRKLGRDLSPSGGGGGKSGGKSGGGGSASASGSSGSGVGWTSEGYYGCLTLLSEELYKTWTYPGSVPGCDYVTHNGDGSTTTVTAQSGSSSSTSSTGTSSQSSSSSSGSSTGTSSQSSSSSSGSSTGTSSQSSSSSSGSSAGTSSQSSSSYSTASNSSQTRSYNDTSDSGSSQTSSYNDASGSGSSQQSSNNAASASDSTQGSSSYNDSSNSDQSSSSNIQGDGEYGSSTSNTNQEDGAYEADGDGDSDAQTQSNASNSEGNDQSDAANGDNYNDNGGQDNYDDSDGQGNNDERDEAYDDNYQGEQGNQGDDGNAQTTSPANYTDPYLSFDIKQCDSYNDLWVWDLAISCDIEKSTENCTCTFTEQLIEKELLTCDDAAYCPADCNICSTCLFLAGCSDVKAAGSIFAQASTSGTFAAAFALTVLLGACCFTFKQKRRRRDGSGLGENLMDDENGGKVWMVPIDYGESDESSKHVWLAPDDANLSETDSSIDAERGVVTKNENITASRKHKLNNHTNSMENSMRKLRPKSADERTAKEISGMVGGFFARLGREYRRIQKRAGKSQDKEVEGDDDTVSTARLNELSGTVFPGVLANLSMYDEVQRRPTSASKKNQEQPSLKKDTVAEEHQETPEEEASQESKTDRSLFPDLLAQPAGERPANVPKKAFRECPPRQLEQTERTVAGQEASVVQTEPEDVQSMDRDDSSSSEEESTVILPPYTNHTSNMEPQLVDGVWLVPIFDEGGSLPGRSDSSDQEDDDEASTNTGDSTICSSITDSYVAEVTKLALSPMSERRQP